MKAVDFPQWSEVLAASPLSGRHKRSFAITIGWYLGFCRRGRAGVEHASARDFIAWAQREKQPEPWQLEEWREAIRWLFRAAKAAEVEGNDPQPVPSDGASPPGHLREAQGGWAAQTRGLASGHAPLSSGVPGGGGEGVSQPGASAAVATPAWKTAFLTTLRRRQYSYRTEQSYLVWIERFARHCGTQDLAGRGGQDIKAFLDALALDQRLSASSQRQALNAVVFLLREVFGKQLGDFSDYRRGKVRTHLPVWLTRSEMKVLLQQLDL